eukprot:CAMPEP_0115435118 /NCGR_PEP_ID=MMETSP0271-20121206/33495_1 /TAXON_ID=71861 /ORGANISM="Scrippsiella trochoidea, Strain CCMP3099" /LENGTH=104 /DNA_ID=CAMNT_0002860567 /DNA_START=292 /DNA_END=606 /DNA_ORIENTATION=-
MGFDLLKSRPRGRRTKAFDSFVPSGRRNSITKRVAYASSCGALAGASTRGGLPSGACAVAATAGGACMPGKSWSALSGSSQALTSLFTIFSPLSSPEQHAAPIF